MALSLEEIEQQYYSSVPVTNLHPDIQKIYQNSSPLSPERGRSAFLLGAALFELKKDCKQYFEESKQIALQIGNNRILADALHGEALGFYQEGDYKRTSLIEENALYLATESDHPNRVAVCYFMLGMVSSYYGAYEETADYFARSLQIALKQGFLRLEVSLLSSLQQLALTSGNFTKAKNYGENYLRVATLLGNQVEIYKAKILLSTVIIELGQFDRVIEILSDVRKTLPAENLSLWCQVHTLQGKVEAGKRRWKAAEAQYKTSLSLTMYPNSSRVKSNILSLLAELYLTRKQHKLALKYSRLSLDAADESQDVYLRKIALRLLHDSYKALKQYKKAYQYLEEYNSLVAESDKELLKSRLEFHELRHDFEAERVKSEEGQRQSELLRIELERKERELTEKTRHLIKQTESLAQFRDDLRAMLRRSPAEDPLVKSIREKLQDMPEPQVNVDDFQAEFNSVHPKFEFNLTRAFPALTHTERKLCPFLRLNLTSEDIAKLMSLSERSIENHRYRIRRKLGLGTADGIAEFLEKY